MITGGNVTGNLFCSGWPLGKDSFTMHRHFLPKLVLAILHKRWIEPRFVSDCEWDVLYNIMEGGWLLSWWTYGGELLGFKQGSYEPLFRFNVTSRKLIIFLFASIVLFRPLSENTLQMSFLTLFDLLRCLLECTKAVIPVWARRHHKPRSAF